MEGRAARELRALEENDVVPAEPRQPVEDRAAPDATPDDHGPRSVTHPAEPKLGLVKLVVQPAARNLIDEHGGAVYLWAETVGCCRARTLVLESATRRPDREFELVHASDGFKVFATPGLVEPDELHLELSRKGRLRAYWNGQGWIG